VNPELNSIFRLFVNYLALPGGAAESRIKAVPVDNLGWEG
jgi:hypothetical protein